MKVAFEGDVSSHLAGKVDCSLQIPDQIEVDGGAEPFVFISADDLLSEGIDIGIKGAKAIEACGLYAGYSVSLFDLIDSEIKPDLERHGVAFAANQADCVANWLEVIAVRLREKYPA